MNFNELYKQASELWPNQIDISDGVSSGNGFFTELARLWNKAEFDAKGINEWLELMTWVIYVNLHTLAKERLGTEFTYITINDLDKEKVIGTLLENLRSEGYESMLEEFKCNNPFLN